MKPQKSRRSRTSQTRAVVASHLSRPKPQSRPNSQDTEAAKPRSPSCRAAPDHRGSRAAETARTPRPPSREGPKLLSYRGRQATKTKLPSQPPPGNPKLHEPPRANQNQRSRTNRSQTPRQPSWLGYQGVEATEPPIRGAGLPKPSRRATSKWRHPPLPPLRSTLARRNSCGSHNGC